MEGEKNQLLSGSKQISIYDDNDSELENVKRLRVQKANASGIQSRGTIMSSIFNMMMATVGAGILSFPFAMKSSGVLLNIAWTAIFAVPIWYSLFLYVEYTKKYFNSLNTFTIEEITQVALGDRAYFFTASMNLLFVIGTLAGFIPHVSHSVFVGYQIIIADICKPVLEDWVGDGSFWASREFVVVSFSILVLIPLSLFTEIHSLVIASIIGIFSVAAVVMVVIAKGFQDIADGTTADQDIHWVVHPGIQVLLSPPIVIFSLSSHTQVPQLYAELKDDKKWSINRILISTVAVSSVLYIITGLFGYLSFGNDTDGDILLNFELNDIFMDITKLLMAGHVLLAFPIQMLPTKRTVCFLIQKLWMYYRNYQQLGLEGIHQPISKLQNAISALGIIFFTTCIAAFTPQVSVVFGIVGSTAGAAVMFVVPALLVLADERGMEYFSRKVFAVGLIVISVLAATVGTGVIIQQEL